MALSKIERAYLEKQRREYDFFQKYKMYMTELKRIYLIDGVEAAKLYINDQADFMIGIAVDELLNDLNVN